MSYPLIRYPLDPTGHNPNNLVLGEVHTLSNAQVRVVAPIYGPFYKEGLTVYDHEAGVLLTKDVDYEVAHLLQDASLTFGQDVYQVLLIKNRAVSPKIRLDYQNVGGNYQNSAKAIADAFETFRTDNRPIDWTNVLNKQYQYPPSLHMHLLEDVVGFGSLVVALERIGQAITLSNIPAFESLIDWVKAFNHNFATDQDVVEMAPVERLVNMQVLLKTLDKYNFNAITFQPSTRKAKLGASFTFSVQCTNYQAGEGLYWTVEHDGSSLGTEDRMFGVTSGFVSIINQQATFVVPTLKKSSTKYGDLRFSVKLRRNNVTGPVVADSGMLFLTNKDPRMDEQFMTLSGGLWEHVCCMNEPNIIPTPESMWLISQNPVM